jgi:GNAT superfamily N-acetyltransferase
VRASERLYLLTILIRSHRASDVPAIARLSEQLGYPVSEAEALNYSQAIERDPDQILLVAEDDSDEPVGWVHVFIARRVFVKPFADLGGLVVDEAARGAHIGAELMQAAETWALEQGCDQIYVRSNVIRKRAHRFYTRLGYESLKHQSVFRKKL